MKCRDRFCKKDALAGSPRCDFHTKKFNFLTRCAADELRAITKNPPRAKRPRKENP